MTFELTRRCRVDTVELAWDRWGSTTGTPLVLCHGYTGSAVDFGLQVPELARDRPVLALDHRGHGSSTNTHDEMDYTLGRLADDLILWLESVASGPVDLLGHSMGGRIVQQVALARPDLLRSLILMDTSAGGFTSPAAPNDVLAAFLAGFDPGQGLPSLVYEGAGPEQDLIDGTVDAEFLAVRSKSSALTDPWAFKALGRQLISTELPSLLPRFGELSLPVTVIAGSLDHPLVDQVPAMIEALPDGEEAVIEGAYHSPQLTHPTEWRAAVQAHLARVAG